MVEEAREKQMDDATKFLTAIWSPGEVREIRCEDQAGNISFGYFDAPEKAAAAVKAYERSHTVYVTLNPCHPGCLARSTNRIKRCGRRDATTSDKDISTLKFLLVDCDPGRPAGVGATEEEKAHALKLAHVLHEKLGAPLIVGDSGNGYHLIYRHNAEKADQLKAFLVALNTAFGKNGASIDGKVFNPSRITKVLGTWSRKGENTADRPYRLSKIVELNLGNDTKLAIPELPAKPAAKPTTQGASQFDVRAYLAQHGIAIKQEKDWEDSTMLVLDHCVFDPSHKGKDASVIVHKDGKLSYQCFHDSCKGKTWHDLRDTIGDPKQPKTIACKHCGQAIYFVKDGDLNIPMENETTRHYCRKKDSAKFCAKIIADNELEKLEEPDEILLDTKRIHPFFNLYWEEIANGTESFREYVMAALLVAIGATIGNKAVLRVSQHGIKPNLYMILIGKSTFMRKTTGMDLGLAPLQRISDAKLQTYFDALEQYDADLEAWSSMTRTEKKTLGKPEKPKNMANIYASDFSPEGLVEEMADKPDGLLAFSEIGKLMSSFNISYMRGFKERLTDFYDGRDVPFVRKLASKIIRVKNPLPSIIGCSTVQWLQSSLSEEDLLSGFLARFLFVSRRRYPVRLVAVPDYFEIDQAIMDMFRRIDTMTPMAVTMSNEASDFYKTWYYEYVKTSQRKDVFLHGFLARLTGSYYKIALIDHVLTCAYESRPTYPVIGVESFQRALPWLEFFTKNAEQCFNEIVHGQDLKELKILETIRTQGTSKDGVIVCSNTKIMKYAHMKSSELREYMDTLREKSMVKQSTDEHGNVFWHIKR